MCSHLRLPRSGAVAECLGRRLKRTCGAAILPPYEGSGAPALATAQDQVSNRRANAANSRNPHHQHENGFPPLNCAMANGRIPGQSGGHLNIDLLDLGLVLRSACPQGAVAVLDANGFFRRDHCLAKIVGGKLTVSRHNTNHGGDGLPKAVIRELRYHHLPSGQLHIERRQVGEDAVMGHDSYHGLRPLLEPGGQLGKAQLEVSVALLVDLPRRSIYGSFFDEPIRPEEVQGHVGAEGVRQLLDGHAGVRGVAPHLLQQREAHDGRSPLATKARNSRLKSPAERAGDHELRRMGGDKRMALESCRLSPAMGGQRRIALAGALHIVLCLTMAHENDDLRASGFGHVVLRLPRRPRRRRGPRRCKHAPSCENPPVLFIRLRCPCTVSLDCRRFNRGASMEALRGALCQLVRAEASRAEDQRIIDELTTLVEDNRVNGLVPHALERAIAEFSFRREWRRARQRSAVDDVDRLLRTVPAVDGAAMRACAEALCREADDMDQELPLSAAPWQRALVAARRRVGTAAAESGPDLVGTLQAVACQDVLQEMALLITTVRVASCGSDPASSHAAPLGDGASSRSADPAAEKERGALDALVQRKLLERSQARATRAAVRIQAASRRRRARVAFAVLTSQRRCERALALARRVAGGRICRTVGALWRRRARRAAAARARRATIVEEVRRMEAASRGFAALHQQALASGRSADRLAADRWRAAMRVQGAARERRWARSKRALRTLQRGVRGFLARRRAERLRAARAKVRADQLHERRALWREEYNAVHAFTDRALAIAISTEAEVTAVTNELRLEQHRFRVCTPPPCHRPRAAGGSPRVATVPQAAFRKWEARMRKVLLQRGLSAEWVPQLSPVDGSAFYFNMATGEARAEHPALSQASAIANRQAALAEKAFKRRLARVVDYRDGVAEAGAAAVQGCLDQARDARQEFIRRRR